MDKQKIKDALEAARNEICDEICDLNGLSAHHDHLICIRDKLSADLAELEKPEGDSKLAQDWQKANDRALYEQDRAMQFQAQAAALAIALEDLKGVCDFTEHPAYRQARDALSAYRSGKPPRKVVPLAMLVEINDADDPPDVIGIDWLRDVAASHGYEVVG